MEATVALPVSLVERLTLVLERLASAGTPAPVDALLTTDQVAARLQKSRRDVERLVKKGKLRKVPNLGARTTRFRPQDVEALLAGGRENLPGARRL